MTIDELRQRIDQLDERLVELLSERAHCALEIGKLKQTLGLEVYQPDREKQVLHHVQIARQADGQPARGGRHRAGVRTDHRRGAAHRARHGS